MRSTGEPTYFAADVAYHEDKLERGYDRMINVLGSDHHGYVARMKAAIAALGADPDRLEIPMLQFVHIVEGGERASMSKRRGDFVTLDELIDEIGVDATRWFMLSRSHDSTIDLDLELARAGVGREPRLLRPVRARAHRTRCWRKAGEERVAAALGRQAQPDELARVRARARAQAARVPGRGGRGRRAPRRRTGSPPTRSSSPRSSPRSTATARSSASSRPRRSRTCGCGCASPRSGRIARALALLGVSAPEQM